MRSQSSRESEGEVESQRYEREVERYEQRAEVDRCQFAASDKRQLLRGTACTETF